MLRQMAIADLPKLNATFGGLRVIMPPKVIAVVKHGIEKCIVERQDWLLPDPLDEPLDHLHDLENLADGQEGGWEAKRMATQIGKAEEKLLELQQTAEEDAAKVGAEIVQVTAEEEAPAKKAADKKALTGAQFDKVVSATRLSRWVQKTKEAQQRWKALIREGKENSQLKSKGECTTLLCEKCKWQASSDVFWGHHTPKFCELYKGFKSNCGKAPDHVQLSAELNTQPRWRKKKVSIPRLCTLVSCMRIQH